ncbi:MAG: response regulator transcription factor [Flavisolibacter sp.]
MEKATILIADTHLLFRQGLRSLLNQNPRFEVVGEANSMKKATELYLRLRPQVLILDTDLTGMNRFELLKLMKVPEKKPMIIALSSNIYPSQAKQILNTGVMGYLTKYATSKEFMYAISEVLLGNLYIDAKIKYQVLNSLFQPSVDNMIDSLTKKEMDIVSLLQGGLTSKQMAEQLRLSPNTIMVHRYNILKKLKLKNVASLVNFIHYNYC